MRPTEQDFDQLTAVLKYRPTETPPLLSAMLLDFGVSADRTAWLVAIPAQTPGFFKNDGEIWRETDSPLEGTGFELLVRRRVKLVVGRRRQRN